MTERAIATGALPQQKPREESATLEDTSLISNGTPRHVGTSKATPPDTIPSSTLSASCEQDAAESQQHPVSQSTTVAASSSFTWYRSVAVQTLPPRDTENFRKIYERDPTDRELVSKIGSAAIGRYTPGPSANPHDVVLGEPFATATVLKRRPNYADSSFQTYNATRCKKALLRSKVKATLLANKQRDAARSAGFKVWSETRDDYIVHSEQFPISIDFDKQGNATNADVAGLSLPNIYGEYMRMGKEAKDAASSLSSKLTPPPTPLSGSVLNTFDEVSTQRILTVEPCIPSERSNQAPIEWYGYTERIQTEATKESGGEEVEQQKTAATEVRKEETMGECQNRLYKEETVMAIGGERFADEYIVYDATSSSRADLTTSSDTDTKTSKKGESDDEWEPQMTASSTKRPQTSFIRDNSLKGGTSIYRDGSAPHRQKYVERGDTRSIHIDHVRTSEHQASPQPEQVQYSTSNRKYDDEACVKQERSPCSSSAHRDSRRRSRSPRDRRSSNHYRSRSSVGRRSEDPYEEGLQHRRVASEIDNDSRTHVGYTDEQDRSREARDSDVQSKVVVDIVSTRKLEADRRLQHVRRMGEEKTAKCTQLEEAEIQRAREAKDQLKLKIAEKKQAQERRQDKRDVDDRNQRLRRKDSRDRSREERRQMAKQEIEPSKPVDRYALGREAEARRRERVFAAHETGEADSRTHQQSSAGNGLSDRSEVKRPELEGKVKQGRVTKPRQSRTARGELERYDPRKKFGRGK